MIKESQEDRAQYKMAAWEEPTETGLELVWLKAELWRGEM